MLERNNAVELKPSMEDLFEAVRKVCEDVMAITEDLPRLALLGTARQLKELEVGCAPHGRPPLKALRCRTACFDWPCLAQPALRTSACSANVEMPALPVPAGAWSAPAAASRELLQCHQG